MNMHKAYKNYNLGFGTIFLNLPVQSHTYTLTSLVMSYTIMAADAPL